MKKRLTICTLTILATVVSCPSFAGQQQKGQNHRFGKFINKFDSNKDGQVTKEEFDLSMQKRFKTMDADNNGVVSKEEFENNTKARHKEYRKKYKATIDIDKDGLVSKKEYLDAKLKKAEKKFARLDKDGNGFLTEEERAASKSRFKKSGHYFPKIDINNDGVIDFDENKASSERMFKRLDSNNDLVITQAEIQAMSEKRRGKK